jgi:hypothetical protein
MAYRGKVMWAAVAYLLVGSHVTVHAHTFDSVSESKDSTGCTGYNASSALSPEDDQGAKLANRKLGRTLLQDSSKLT